MPQISLSMPGSVKPPRRSTQVRLERNRGSSGCAGAPWQQHRDHGLALAHGLPQQRLHLLVIPGPQPILAYQDRAAPGLPDPLLQERRPVAPGNQLVLIEPDADAELRQAPRERTYRRFVVAVVREEDVEIHL
jgi:hypothetical protein